MASEPAAELQEQDAPELRLRGAALGGLVLSSTTLYDAITGTQYAGDLPGVSRIGISGRRR